MYHAQMGSRGMTQATLEEMRALVADGMPRRARKHAKEGHVHDLSQHPGGVIGARVYNSANISTTSGVAAVLTFDSERFDTDGIHSTSSNTSRLTCVTAGKYIITGNVMWASNTVGRRQLKIVLNGATTVAFMDETAHQTFEHAETITTIYDFAVGDYVELHAYQDSTGALNVLNSANSSPEFSMMRIGAAGGNTTEAHSLHSGLLSDDHTQYLLADGSRNLTGNLAVSAGVTIDGIDVGAHVHSGGTLGLDLPLFALLAGRTGATNDLTLT